MNFKTVITSFTLSLIYSVATSQVTLDIKERPKPVPTFNFRKISSNKDFIYNLGIDDKGEKSIYFIEKYNAKTLELLYQKDLKICADDKAALVHPLFVPPVCFESNNQFVVFYNSFNETDKSVKINVKTMNEKGEINPKWITLISSKDIDVQMEGMYFNTMGYYKPAIGYQISDDKKTVIIEIDCPKLKKIYTYAIADLIVGKTEHKEFDVKALVEKEKIVINKCFFVTDNLYFSYTKTNSNKIKDFGFATLDIKANNFQLKNLELTVNDLFSLDYILNQSSNKIFVVGYLRYPINPSKAVSIENSKVKQFTVQFNLNAREFENKNEFDFSPNVAKLLSIPKTAYGFIEKTHTPDQYLENIALVESSNYYFSISHLLFGRGPTAGFINPMGVGAGAQGGGGVTTVSRDILVSKFDKTGKFINQYLLPCHTGYNTVAVSRSGVLWGFANKQRNFNYGIKGDDLHFFYLDNKKNIYNQSEEYDPRNTDKCVVDNGALIHMSIKKDKVEREIVAEKDHKCYFYSNQNLMVNDAVILDLEISKKNSELGRVIIN